MANSSQQMVSSGFNIPISSHGASISHMGSERQVSPGYASSLSQSDGNAFLSPTSASHVSSTSTFPATYVTTSSQWPVAVDGACCSTWTATIFFHFTTIVDADLGDDLRVMSTDDAHDYGDGVSGDLSQPLTTHSSDNTHGEVFTKVEQGCDEIMVDISQFGDEIVTEAVMPEVNDSVPNLFGTNRHAMSTRSKNGIRKPKDFHVQASSEPKNIREALKDPNWWKL
ncbi:hypothetical protein V6N11_028712 [Hibiscus sabdariffa]|uniref:Uncharacterized protein n=1 Tax=Hibiscus sabdariffa TaxID=183260 RepID=A0ABR2PR84_9ROSI